MPRFLTQFGGLNTDISPNHLPSGSADTAVNVVVEKGDLKKRSGFAEFEDDVTGAGDSVLGLWSVRFGDGDVYVIAKCDDGKLYQRKMYPADAGSFTEITTNQTHNANDIGWAFMWYDRWHYFDRGGGSRWNPDKNSGTAYKAGLPRATVGATPTAGAAAVAKGAGMHGKYRVVPVYRFSETEEEGQFAGPNTPAVQCALNSPDDSSGLAISNWASIKGVSYIGDYEIDQVHFYVSKGHTEYVPRGDGYEAFPHKYYDGSIVDIGDASASCNKGDHISDVTTRLTNAGGEPPASVVGCYTGVRGIYGGIYESGSLVPGKIMYSIPDYPTSVPQNHTYTQGGDSKTVEPEPWRGVSYTPFEPTEIMYGGGRAVAFTPTEAWSLASYGDGRLYTKRVYAGAGCAGHGAACVAGDEIHALGYGTWLTVGSSVQELSYRQFRTTLADVPGVYYSSTRMAYYSFEDQVWAAVVESGGTKATKILVWDRRAGILNRDGRPSGALVEFKPACLGSSGITAMCELAYPGQTPIMLVATDAGQILKYPSGTDDDGTDFEAQWVGYFAAERLNRDQKVERLQVYTGDNCDGNVVVKWRCMRTADETSRTQHTVTLAMDNEWQGLAGNLDEIHGNIFQVEFYTANTVSEQWTVRGMAWHLTSDDVKG